MTEELTTLQKGQPSMPDPGDHTLPRELGAGLVLRRATPLDTEKLIDFNVGVHRDPANLEPEEAVASWVADMMRGDHPTVGSDDFTIVEDAATGAIVSSCTLISQTWSYEGIPFGVGRPDLVGTLTAYRRRGLVRAQFDELHRWSAARGEPVQAITGIPFFYRQFGYEMAMSLGGGRSGYRVATPPLKDGEVEPFILRPATPADIPLLIELDRRNAARALVSCPRDEALWRYELEGKSALNVNRMVVQIVEANGGRAIGAVGYAPTMWWGNRLGVLWCEVLQGYSWIELLPSLLRGLWKLADGVGEQAGAPVDRLYFSLGADHPLNVVAGSRMPEVRRSYAWYLRVADLPAFVRHVAPALEAHLAGSVAEQHSADVKLSFYGSGMRLVLERGRLITCETWMPPGPDDGDAAFPGLSFLQLLFGFRCMDELIASYPDCWSGDDGTLALLNALFPKKWSKFHPIA